MLGDFGERSDDRVALIGDLDQPHHAMTTRADHDVDREHSLQQPRPWMSSGMLGDRLEFGRVAIEQQPHLRRCGRLGHTARDNFAARVGMGSEHAVIPQHVQARRRDQCGEACDEIEWIEDDGVGSVSPRTLERIRQPATIGRQ